MLLRTWASIVVEVIMRRRQYDRLFQQQLGFVLHIELYLVMHFVFTVHRVLRG